MRFLLSPWQKIWENSELLIQLLQRKIKLKYVGSAMGVVWEFLGPLMLLGLYVFIFGYVFQGSFSNDPSESRITYAIGVFLGLTIFHLLAEIIAISVTSILSVPNFVKKVVFPLEIQPVIDCFVALKSFSVSLLMVILAQLLLGDGITLHLLWLIPIVAAFCLFILGVSWMISSVSVYIRDIGQLTQFISMAIMFGSAVFYPSSKIPDAAFAFLKYNPVLQAIEMSRDVLLWHKSPETFGLVYLSLISVFTFYLGYFIFKALRDGFADVI